MTVKGRTTPRWGRDKSARWDSHEGNGFRTRSYPARPEGNPAPVKTVIEQVDLPGRPGAAERDLTLTWADDDTFTLQLTGWYTTTVDLNERQARFLRDTLRNRWFPAD